MFVKQSSSLNYSGEDLFPPLPPYDNKIDRRGKERPDPKINISSNLDCAVKAEKEEFRPKIVGARREASSRAAAIESLKNGLQSLFFAVT